MVEVELFYIEILPVWTYFSCISECIFKMFEKIKKENMYTKSFYIYFYRVYLQSFINRDFVFSIFTTLYGIGNIVIITLQLCVFALDTWYSLE